MPSARVVVAGAIANKPGNAGEAWVRLNWIRGLQRLGCDVWFVEQIAAARLVDETGRRASSLAGSANARWFDSIITRFGLRDRAWLECDNGELLGPQTVTPPDVADGATLVNISGHLVGASMSAFGRRLYVDIDPGFTQIWEVQGNAGARLTGHDCYFTIGSNVGTPRCAVPQAGVRWHPIRPPVVLDDWPAADTSHPEPRFTTVATWRGPFGPLQLDGRVLGLKVHQFRRFVELPTHVDAVFEAALAIDPAEANDLDLLARHGWRVVPPASVVGTPDKYRDYLSTSVAEFSAAQGVYVETNSGWFSDRSAAYMASGRPVVVQDTGFSSTLPVGEGLVAFSTVDEAIAGATSILDDPERHACAARKLAAEYFDSDVVLADVLDRAESP